MAKLHISSDRQAALQDSCDKSVPKLPHVLPWRRMGRPPHLEPSGTSEARTISKAAPGPGVGCEGAGVGAPTGTFCQFSKNALTALEVSHDPKAEQAPLLGLKMAKLHSSSDRQAALQDSESDKPVPKLPHVLPWRRMGRPPHLEPSGTSEARTISKAVPGAGGG